MTRNDDFIGHLESYLDEYEGHTPLPDAVRDAIRAELPHTKQTGSLRGLSRIQTMTLQIPAPARYGLAAAAIVAAVIIGANLFRQDTSVGPSATPTATASASASGPMSLLDSPREGDLPPGHYYIDIPAFPARIDFEVPEGWWYYWPTTSRTAADVHAILVNSLDSGAANGSAWGIAFAVVEDVPVDPCDPAAGTMDSSVTESAEALQAAFETWTDVEVIATLTDLESLVGKVVTPTTFSKDCTGWFFRTPASYTFDVDVKADEGVVDPEQFTFLDVDGSVLVIWTTDYPQRNQFEIEGGASPDPVAHVEDQVVLREILDSIVITPR